MTLVSEKLQRFEFQIKNTGQSPSSLNAQASAKSLRIIRDNSYLAYVSAGSADAALKNCWKNLLINKQVKIVTKSYSQKQLISNRENITFQVSFDPSTLEIFNLSENVFKQRCLIN
tara:strand:+ start:2633 stop:2980 length:348 start_codon:yes stop_codon:yes gene_type:complete